MKKKIFIALLVILIAGTTFFFIKGRSVTDGAENQPISVNTIEVKPGSIESRVTADGNVITMQKKNVIVKLNSFVEEIIVEEGELVNKGQSLIILENKDILTQLNTAKLDLREAEHSYNKLYDKYLEQDELHSLKIKEAEKNLKISLLSAEENNINLQSKKEKLEQQLKERKRSLDKAQNNLQDKKYLYENEAISQKDFIQAEETYEEAKISYNSIKEELNILKNKTIPNSSQLSKLRIENARNNLELLKKNIREEKITQEELDMAKITVEKAQNRVANLEGDLENTIVKAPIEGTIVEIKVEEGDKTASGIAALEIANLNQLVIEVLVDEIDVNQLSTNQKAVITSDSFKDNLNGRVSYISPVSTKSGNINKYKTRVVLEDTKSVLKPGMFVNAEIITNRSEDALTVPAMAVMGEEDKYIFVARDGKAIKREVELGIESLSKVELKGIKEGARVVVGPFQTLKQLQNETPIKEQIN